MIKIYFTFIFAFISFMIYGITVPNEKFTEKQKVEAKIYYHLQQETVLDTINKCYADILKFRKSKKPMPNSKYINYSSKLKYYINYRWLLADTSLSKKWLKKVYKLVDYMKNTQELVKTLKANRDTANPKYQQGIKYFDVAFKNFAKLVKKPVKISGKLHRKLKLQRILWEKKMRKKYKIKQKF